MPLDTEGPLRKLMNLLREDTPACTVKDGSPYRLDKQRLQNLADKLIEKEKLRLPITLTFNVKLSDYCNITDETSSAILRRLEVSDPPTSTGTTGCGCPPLSVCTTFENTGG